MSTATDVLRSDPADVRQLLRRATDVVRDHVRTLGDTARGPVAGAFGVAAAKVRHAIAAPLRRLGAVAERYVGAKIKRRVQPPILVAIVVGAVALIVAIVAAARK